MMATNRMDSEITTTDSNLRPKAAGGAPSSLETLSQPALMAALIESLPHQAFISDRNGAFLSVNAAFAAEWGFKPEELTGKRDFEVIPGVKDPLKELSKEVTYPGKKNQRIHFTTTPIKDSSGQFLGILGVSTAPEDQRMSKLRESEAEFRRVWEQSFDGMRVIDMNGVMLMVNDAFCSLVGKSREELVGQNLSVIYAPEHQLGIIARHKERAMTKVIASISEREHRLWNGKKSWFELSNTLIELEDQPPQILSIFRDVTERRRDEERLREFTALLERSNRELQDFAYVASHDLQEPLRKVTVFGDRLRSLCGSSLSSEGTEYLNRMLNAARRMQTLINDLLSFSRITFKAQPFEPVNLDTAAREVLEDLEARIEHAGATLELGPLPTISAEPLQMRQLLQNLIGNALKFQRPGVKPLIKIDSKTIEAPAPDGESISMLELSVSDNGIGFDEKYSARIFQVFQRLHTREAYEGTGMGLAIVRKICECHGGSISAKSTPGAGSTFVVRLPLTPKKQAAPAPPAK